MRRILLISGVVIGAVVLIAAALTAYAFFNLSSIVARNESRILARVSDELGRRVEIGKIQAQMGWGVSVEVSGLKIADDSSFSAKPFLAADEVSIEVEFIPLLRGAAKVTRLKLIKPDIRIVMNARGDLNLSTIGSSPDEVRRKTQEAPPSRRAKRRSSLADLSIKALSIENGAIYFNDLGEKMAPIHVRHLDFDVTDFNAASAFDVETKFAFPGEEQNVEASGKLGPILDQGVPDASGMPVDLKLQLDSILLDKVRPLAEVGSEIPPGLSIPDAVSVSGTVRGSFGKLAIALSTDLSGDRVAYAALFNKPAGTAMTLNANGTWADQLEIASVNLKLSDLELTASRFSGGGTQPLSAQIDSNSFNLANLSPMIDAAAGYGVSGMSEIHGTAKLDTNAPAMDGTVTLKQVAVKLGPSWPGGISDLNGKIRFTDGLEVVEPTSFTLGSAHANLEGRVESISPLKASYALKADSVKLAQVFAFAGIQPGDVINQLAVKGTADGAITSPRMSATIQSTDGSLENIPYRNLDLTAAYFNGRASAHPLNVGVFGGSLTAQADAVFGAAPTFNVTLEMNNLNVEQALRSQKYRGGQHRARLSDRQRGGVGQRRGLESNQADVTRQRASGNRERQAGGRQYRGGRGQRSRRGAGSQPTRERGIQVESSWVAGRSRHRAAIGKHELSAGRATVHDARSVCAVAGLQDHRRRLVRHGQEPRHERRHPAHARTGGRDPSHRDRETARGARAAGRANIGGARRDGRDQRARQDNPRRSERGGLDGRCWAVGWIVDSVDSESD